LKSRWNISPTSTAAKLRADCLELMEILALTGICRIWFRVAHSVRNCPGTCEKGTAVDVPGFSATETSQGTQE